MPRSKRRCCCSRFESRPPSCEAVCQINRGGSFSSVRTFQARERFFLNLDSHAQESRWNGSRIFIRAFVVLLEQSFQFLLQFIGFAIFFRGVEGVHCWPVISTEIIDEGGG